MNMVTALITDALRLLDGKDVAQSLHETASAIVGFCDQVKNHPVRSVLERYGFSLPASQSLDASNLPDAVWSAICLEGPHLYYYPLGEIAERATKKTLASLILGRDADEAVNEQEAQGQLGRSVSNMDTEGLLQLFVSHYFFELSINYLRRSSKNLHHDFGYWYHFSEAGTFSLETEQELRKTLKSQCEEAAEKFLPSLSDCLEEQDTGRIERRIRKGLVENFGPPGHGLERSQESDRAFVNVVVGGRPLNSLRESHLVAEKPLRFLLHTKRRNVSFSFDKMERFLRPLRAGGQVRFLHPLVKDLLDIAVAVYMSDRYVKREPHLGRRIGLLMPVRYPEIWSKAQVCTELERAVSFLARDDFTIQFVRRKERTDCDLDFLMGADEKRCVCLLSGGLDSAAGAVWAFEKGLEPIFVSHYASGKLAAVQKELVSQLEGVLADRLQDSGGRLRHLGVYVNRSRVRSRWYPLGASPKSVMVQHLRSFLFLSLATAVALELGIRKVYMFENGPVALNPSISEARVNTRTAHPHFLVLFKRLIKTVSGVSLEIENPFLYHTKGEIAKLLAGPRRRELVRKTESCWYVFRVRWRAIQLGVDGFTDRHDGDCFPCIIRRAAVDHAGLWKKDAKYLVDVFTEFPDLPRRTVTGIADLLRFCQNVRTLSDAEVLLHAPDFSVGAEGVDARELVAMYRRHSEEVLRCFRKRSNKAFQEVFASAFTGM